ncbi:MAG: GspH/FimT family pseudopilin [Gammaproteobacteria bacterium]|nr:GspH/FimT family pseudopilin [Gammaproteobacteria bacterium]MDH3467361.1 GspH/FimT family pseudopilin [Gammaproteobacteria bacterium]
MFGRIFRCTYELRGRGFSLLEMMVVLLLIGLAASVAVLNLDRDFDKIAEREANRFAALVEHSKQESIITGRTIGIELDLPEHSFRFMQPGTTWIPIESDDLFRERRFAEGVTVEWTAMPQREGQSSNALIVVDTLGSITPFTIIVRGDNAGFTVTSSGDEVGVERVDNES